MALVCSNIPDCCSILAPVSGAASLPLSRTTWSMLAHTPRIEMNVIIAFEAYGVVTTMSCIQSVTTKPVGSCNDQTHCHRSRPKNGLAGPRPTCKKAALNTELFICGDWPGAEGPAQQLHWWSQLNRRIRATKLRQVRMKSKSKQQSSQMRSNTHGTN